MRRSAGLRAYAPFLVLFALAVVGLIYTAGFASGQRTLLLAAEQAAREAKQGV